MANQANRNTIYLRFFRAIQSIEDILNVVERRSDRFRDDIEIYRDGLEYVADKTIALAAEHDWTHAYEQGEFVDFYHDFETFARRHWNDILLHESARLKR